MTTATVIVLLVVAMIGHAMAAFWYVALQRRWAICQRTIYDLPIDSEQVKRELANSIHSPIHALLLGLCVYFGFFANRSVLSFIGSALLTMIWAEIWHYASHRAMHLPALHWIHAEHHKSHLNTPLTALSFSFTEKFLFDIGILGALAAVDRMVSLNMMGVAAWYTGYLVINSFSHANFELKAKGYNAWLGKVLTSTTYHSLHHSRYTGNYGLGTRVLDRLFKTEWEDYERIFERVTAEQRPLKRLSEHSSSTPV